MVKPLTALAASMLTLYGCATNITPDILPSDTKIIEAAYNQDSNSFVLDIDNKVMRSGGGGCLRSVNWSSEASECGESTIKLSLAPQPTVEEPPILPAQPVYVSETLNGNAMFELDSADISDAGILSLEKLIVSIGDVSGDDGSIEIIGHTDDTGSEKYNQQLADKRAQNVRDFLETRVQGLQVTASAQGELAPIADNATEAGRAQNRRVEVLVRKRTIVE